MDGDLGPTLMFMGGNSSHGPRRPERKEFTVKEYAHREQVDERTVRRWITKGALTVRRTPGGRVRIREDV